MRALFNYVSMYCVKYTFDLYELPPNLEHTKWLCLISLTSQLPFSSSHINSNVVKMARGQAGDWNFVAPAGHQVVMQ